MRTPLMGSVYQQLYSIHSESVTFSGDLDRNAACRGPEIELGVACTQCQPGAMGVPLKATHSRCLLKHSCKVHLLHVPYPDNSGHVVYGQRSTDTHWKPLSAYRGMKKQLWSKNKVITKSVGPYLHIPVIQLSWVNNEGKSERLWCLTVFSG